jgi:hypothetical protein
MGAICLLQQNVGESQSFLAATMYGALCAYVTLGIFTDLIAQRSLYTLMAIIITTQSVFIIVQLVYSLTTKTIDLLIEGTSTCFLFGYFYTLVTTL